MRLLPPRAKPAVSTPASPRVALSAAKSSEDADKPLALLRFFALGERLVALSDATRILSRNLARFATLRCWCEGRERIA